MKQTYIVKFDINDGEYIGSILVTAVDVRKIGPSKVLADGLEIQFDSYIVEEPRLKVPNDDWLFED